MQNKFEIQIKYNTGWETLWEFLCQDRDKSLDIDAIRTNQTILGNVRRELNFYKNRYSNFKIRLVKNGKVFYIPSVLT